MPTDRDYLAALVMGEAANQDEVGMALVMDVLANRAFSDNPAQYGSAPGHATASFAGQALASIPSLQFSSTDRAQSIREGGAGAYERFAAALYAPETLSDVDAAAYERALEIADTFVNPESPNYGAYRGIARGADFFDTGTVNSWAGRQEWGQQNAFRHGGHVFRSTQPLQAEFGTPQNMGGAQAMQSPRGITGMFPTPPTRGAAPAVQEISLRRGDGALPQGALPYAAANAFPEADLRGSVPTASASMPTPPPRPGDLPAVSQFGTGPTAGMTGIGRDPQGGSVGYRNPDDFATGTLGNRPADDARTGRFSQFDVVTTTPPGSAPRSEIDDVMFGPATDPVAVFDAQMSQPGGIRAGGLGRIPGSAGIRYDHSQFSGQSDLRREAREQEEARAAAAGRYQDEKAGQDVAFTDAPRTRSRLSTAEPPAVTPSMTGERFDQTAQRERGSAFGVGGPHGTAPGAIGDPYETETSPLPSIALMDDAGDVAARARAASQARVAAALPVTPSMTFDRGPVPIGSGPSPTNDARLDSRNVGANPAFAEPGGAFTLAGPRGPDAMTIGPSPDRFSTSTTPPAVSWASLDPLERAPVVAASPRPSAPAPLDISPAANPPTPRSRLATAEPPAPAARERNPIAGVGGVIASSTRAIRDGLNERYGHHYGGDMFRHDPQSYGGQDATSFNNMEREMRGANAPGLGAAFARDFGDLNDTGAAIGAAVGGIAGPPGAVMGAIAGGVVGRSLADAVSDFFGGGGERDAGQSSASRQSGTGTPTGDGVGGGNWAW